MVGIPFPNRYPSISAGVEPSYVHPSHVCNFFTHLPWLHITMVNYNMTAMTEKEEIVKRMMKRRKTRRG
jgi:hypothetical protein